MNHKCQNMRSPNRTKKILGRKSTLTRGLPKPTQAETTCLKQATSILKGMLAVAIHSHVPRLRRHCRMGKEANVEHLRILLQEAMEEICSMEKIVSEMTTRSR